MDKFGNMLQIFLWVGNTYYASDTQHEVYRHGVCEWLRGTYPNLYVVYVYNSKIMSNRFFLSMLLAFGH